MLLGENGRGKTSVLQALALVLVVRTSARAGAGARTAIRSSALARTRP